jgi:hypothetical protein
MADQHVPHHLIGAIDLERHGLDAEPTRVSEPAPDDVGPPLGAGVGHHQGVEVHLMAEVGGHDGGLRAIRGVEPEQLRDVVGRARPLRPPPLQIGGFEQAGCRVRPTDPLQQHRPVFHAAQAEPMLLAPLAHSSNLLGRQAPTHASPAPGVRP